MIVKGGRRSHGAGDTALSYPLVYALSENDDDVVEEEEEVVVVVVAVITMMMSRCGAD